MRQIKVKLNTYNDIDVGLEHGEEYSCLCLEYHVALVMLQYMLEFYRAKNAFEVDFTNLPTASTKTDPILLLLIKDGLSKRHNQGVFWPWKSLS
ncbi:hypothetical protein TNCT_166761 [Trichonephila clavata]|uniref:Uncharacterized protein n=1 Tax=Trichonephila clavata TaxID=2740835 RepID=A0A8X6GYP8_TRICU|nr:hypothetical protein TNCT_166761 [Trichonephila clavata]